MWEGVIVSGLKVFFSVRNYVVFFFFSFFKGARQ